MFKRLAISLVLILAVLAGFFGAQMGMDHDEEPMSQACAAHCVDAAIANYAAPVVTQEIFFSVFVMVAVSAGWMLFPHVVTVFIPFALARPPDRLRDVRSTIFQE